MEAKVCFEKEMFFSKTYPSFLTVKEGSTSRLGLLPSGKKRETALQCCICPTCPSPAGGSLTHSQALALSKRARDVIALRCSEPLRFMVGGASKPSPCFAGWDRMGITLFSDILLVTCRFLAFSLVVSQKMHNFAT